MSKYQIIIGRAEKVDIVGVVQSVPAKIDTGAYWSSIHCKSSKIIEKDGKKILAVEILGHQCAPIARKLEFSEYEQTDIINSFGHKEKRYIVNLKVKLGPKIFTSEFTLANRSNNVFPVLVGRRMLRNRFVVDVSKTAIDRSKLIKEYNLVAPDSAEDLE